MDTHYLFMKVIDLALVSKRFNLVILGIFMTVLNHMTK